MIHRLLETLRALSALLADPDGALLAADEAELAALRARTPLRYTPMLHSDDCPMHPCSTCLQAAVADAVTPICQPPTHIGRRAIPDESFGEVANWLREALPEMWHASSPDAVRLMAQRLVLLRDEVEAGRWKV